MPLSDLDLFVGECPGDREHPPTAFNFGPVGIVRDVHFDQRRLEPQVDSKPSLNVIAQNEALHNLIAHRALMIEVAADSISERVAHPLGHRTGGESGVVRVHHKLAADRGEYVKTEARKRGLKDDKALDKAVRESIAEQGAKKGFKFED